METKGQMNATPPDYQVIRGGLLLDVLSHSVDAADILVEGDTIREIGPPGLDAPAEAETIDARDRLLMPGLVNAHTHGSSSLSKGLGDKWSLELFLNAGSWVGGGYTLETLHTAALLNAAEMVLKGCTAAYDMYLEFPVPSRDGIVAVGNAYSEIGVRAVLAPMMSDTTLYQAIPGLLDALPEPYRSHVEKIAATPYSDHLAACGDFVKDWPFDREKVTPGLGPTIPLHCSDEFIVGCRDLANEHALRIQMHLGESKVQAISGVKRYGKTLAAHIGDLGLLGPRFTGAHGVWLDDDDLKLLRDSGSTIAHNPGSNLRLGSGIAPARRILDMQVGCGIGTDGSGTSDHQNMFEAMRLASNVSRIMVPDPDEWLGTWDVLQLATVGGAGVLGWGDMIGRLAPGFKADIVFLDLSNINFTPLNDAANQVVNCEDSSAVDSVMIGGRVVLSSRRFTSFDYDALRGRVAEEAERLKSINSEARGRADAMAQYVSRHCVGLTRTPYHVERRMDAMPVPE